MTAAKHTPHATSASGGAERVSAAPDSNETLSKRFPEHWTLTIPAPYVKPVTKRKTGKVFQRKPWLNSNDRDHWRVTSPIVKQWRTESNEQAAATDLPKGLARVRVDAAIIKPRAGRYDAGNFYPTAKAIVDGLIDYGLCADDSNDYVEGPFLTDGGKGDAAVVLTITAL